MKRLSRTPRPNWQRTVEELGLSYWGEDHDPYWDEANYYEFSAAQIDQLEAATFELHSMCLQAVEHIVSRRLYSRFEIPELYWNWIEKSWERERFSLYGRFDFWFDGRDIKLLEYNADTPTGLIEAAVIQWHWMRDVFGENGDQWNSMHERLIDSWAKLKRESGETTVYIAGIDDGSEDFLTTQYLRDTALQAGFDAVYLPAENIGWNARASQFRDMREREIKLIFKLYPWEWMLIEPFGKQLPHAKTRWIEPAWKMLLSNKTILAILWELFPDHSLLLRTEMQAWQGDYARKPTLGREGANTQLVKNGTPIDTSSGLYRGPFVYQELRELPEFDGRFPVCGAWVINDYAAGLGIREDGRRITTNNSNFVPHILR